MFQIIKTRYLGPTDTKGTRIKAWAGGMSVTISRDFDIEVLEDHARAVAALLVKLNSETIDGWGRAEDWHGGVLGADDCVWVWVPKS